MAVKKGIPPEVVHAWETWWKDIVAPKGRLNREAVMRELYDYGVILDGASKVYDHITGGMISKPNTDPSVVIAVATDKENEALEEILKDEKEAWEKEFGMEQMCHVALFHDPNKPSRVRVIVAEGTFFCHYNEAEEALEVDPEKPLPEEWIETVKEAVESLLNP